MNSTFSTLRKPGTRRSLAGVLGLLLVLGMLAMLAMPVAADAPLTPFQFYGDVTLDGFQAPETATVDIKIGGVTQFSSNVDSLGRYGWEPLCYIARDGVPKPTTIEFYVNGIHDAAADYIYATSTDVGGRVDLAVETEGNHSLTVTSNGCCPITVGALGTVPAGGSATYSVADSSVINLTANTDACCEFTSWTGPVADTGSASTTVTVNADVTVIANCTALGPYTLTTGANPPEGGSVSGGGSYDCGDMASVTATANSGWTFTGWSGALSGTTNPASIPMDGNKTVTANFAQNVFNLTVTSNGCCTITVGTLGTVAAGGSQVFPVAQGSIVNLTANTGTCCTFSSWTGPVANTGSASTTVTVNAAVTVVANCSTPGPYTLTANANPPEGGSVSGGGSYTCGQMAEVEATANAGWVFTGWSGALGGSTNPTSLLMDGNKTVTANFAEDTTTFTLTISSSGGGSVITPGEGVYSYAPGTDVPLMADPDPCCDFAGWTGPVDNPAAAATTIHMDGNKVISAEFNCPEPVLSIPLSEGWNTFSVPIALNPCMDTWGEFLDFNNLDAVVVYGYNADTKAWVQAMPGTALNVLDGYFIKLNSAGTAGIFPNPDLTAPPEKNLKTGLNLVGVASMMDVDVVFYLSTIYTVPAGNGYSMVLNPSINTPNDWINNAYARDGMTVPTMNVGNAYWVTMVNPGVLQGLTSTPYLP